MHNKPQKLMSAFCIGHVSVNIGASHCRTARPLGSDSFYLCRRLRWMTPLLPPTESARPRRPSAAFRSEDAADQTLRFDRRPFKPTTQTKRLATRASLMRGSVPRRRTFVPTDALSLRLQTRRPSRGASTRLIRSASSVGTCGCTTRALRSPMKAAVSSRRGDTRTCAALCERGTK